jgi:hypothetical protein
VGELPPEAEVHVFLNLQRIQVMQRLMPTTVDSRDTKI